MFLEETDHLVGQACVIFVLERDVLALKPLCKGQFFLIEMNRIVLCEITEKTGKQGVGERPWLTLVVADICLSDRLLPLLRGRLFVQASHRSR